MSHFSTRQSCSDLRNQTGGLFHQFESRVTSFRYASGEFTYGVLLVKDANAPKREKEAMRELKIANGRVEGQNCGKSAK